MTKDYLNEDEDGDYVVIVYFGQHEATVGPPRSFEQAKQVAAAITAAHGHETEVVS